MGWWPIDIDALNDINDLVTKKIVVDATLCVGLVGTSG
jgi:hypothetical protein